MGLKWYLRKLMANVSLFLGIDSSQESIPPELSGTHTLAKKSIPASKLRLWAGNSIPQLDPYSVPMPHGRL